MAEISLDSSNSRRQPHHLMDVVCILSRKIFEFAEASTDFRRWFFDPLANIPLWNPSLFGNISTLCFNSILIESKIFLNFFFSKCSHLQMCPVLERLSKPFSLLTGEL